MEMRDLLEKLNKFAGEKVGQKPGEQWQGNDPNPPGKKLVGDSLLKDLSKGKTPKTKEQELAEEFQAFLEAEFKDTVDRRPGRKGARPARGHEPKSGYKTVKTDETVGQEYTVVIDRKGREKPVSGTMEELLGYFGYTLEVGKSYEHEKGRYKINMAPKNVQQLVDALNKAKSNAAANGHSDTYYSVGQGQIAESHYKWEVTFKDGKQAIYHHNSPHYKDDTAASDIQYTLKSNPGATVKAYKDDQPFDWESLLSEGWESGPEEYKEPYDDADDAYERHRQEKIDTEAEREWAKLPKVSTYKLLGRGPNMEPNYEFGGTEYDTLEQAIEARKQLMADPKTPHPEHIGIQTLTRVVDKKKTQSAEESRGHKIIATKLKDIERQRKFAAGELKIPTPQERRAELEKTKKPVKEYGATSTGSPTSGNTDISLTKPNDPEVAKKVSQATTTLKSATQNAAPNTSIAKALDAASQGKSVNATDMKALEPMMDVIQKTATDPQLANQFKQLVQKVRQAKV